MLTRCLVACALVSAACSPTPPAGDAGDAGHVDDVSAADVCVANGATLTVATGTDSTIRTLRPIADGDEVYLTPGPQGAQHVWVGLLARGFDFTQPRVEMLAFREGDNLLLGQLRVRLRWLESAEPGVWALPSQTLIIGDDRYCSVLPGNIRVTLDVTDTMGHCVRTERRVRVAGIDPLALEVDREAWLRCCTSELRRCFPDGGVRDASVE